MRSAARRLVPTSVGALVLPRVAARAVARPTLARVETHCRATLNHALTTTRNTRSNSTTTGRSAADAISDALGEANLLLNDLLDDDDRESEDFFTDLDEVREAYQTVLKAYESALAALPADEQTGLKKNFELAVVGLRDKLQALEKEAGGD